VGEHQSVRNLFFGEHPDGALVEGQDADDAGSDLKGKREHRACSEFERRWCVVRPVDVRSTHEVGHGDHRAGDVGVVARAFTQRELEVLQFTDAL